MKGVLGFVFALLCVGLWGTPSLAQSSPETEIASANTTPAQARGLFDKANEAYRQDDMTLASRTYEELLAAGFTAADVYFNLGNAYYKLGQIPKAILHFERARKLEPADPDVMHNLQLARGLTVDKIEAVPQLFIWGWLQTIRDFCSADTWTILFLLALWISVAAFAGRLFLKGRSRAIRRLTLMLGVLGCLLTIVLGMLSYQRSLAENSEDTAIIMAASIYVKSAPDESSKDILILHEGTRVEIIEDLGDWRRIKIANGQEGWSRSETMEII